MMFGLLLAAALLFCVHGQKFSQTALTSSIDKLLFKDVPGFSSSTEYEELKNATGNENIAQNILKNFYALSNSTTCSLKMVRNTFDTSHSDIYLNRTDDEVTGNYTLTYDEREQNHGILNQYGLSQFKQLNDVHLLKRFIEADTLTYCDNDTSRASVLTKNTRLGQTEILIQGNDYNDKMIYYASFNDQTKLLTFVFRGTANKQDYIIDLVGVEQKWNFTALPLNTTSEKEDPQVHAGFFMRFEHYQANVTRDFVAAMDKIQAKYGYNPTQYSIVTTGHSLGAVWCFIQTADWAVRGYNISATYVYGQPIVGNQVLSDALAAQIGNDRYIRVVNRNDMIPHLGFAPQGFHARIPNENFVENVSDDNKARLRPNGCAGGQDPTCSINIDCKEWSWYPHSEFELFSARSDFCRINKQTPDSVYGVRHSV